MLAQTIQPRYTIALIAMRYVFLILTFLFNGIYFIKYFSIPQQQRLYQQSLVLQLGITLLFFNDPFFVLYIFLPNQGSSVFSTITLSVFVSYWFYFWTSMLSFIKQKMQPTNKGMKLISFILLAGFTFGSLLAYHLQMLKHPYFDNGLITSVKVLIVISVILYVFYTIYICYMGISLCGQQYIWRNTLFLMITFIYVPITVIALANFSLSVYAIGVQVVMVVINYNLLVWIHLYLYMPTNQSIEQGNQIQMLQRQSDSNYLQLDDIGLDDIQVTLSQNKNKQLQQSQLDQKEYNH